MNNKLSLIISAITIFGFVSTGIIAWGKIVEKTDKIPVIEKKIEEIKEEDIEKVEEDINDNEKVDLEQTILIKQISETLNKLNEKLDRKEKTPK